jgi:tetratricopeptide (TPR) repeat protein
MWCCPRCYFAASYKNFTNPLKNTHMPIDIVQRHLREAAQMHEAYGDVVEILGENTDPVHPDFAQAIRLNMLAIYVFDQILPLLKQNFIVQAGYYMHLAWLYRDLADRPKDQDEVLPVLEKVKQRLHEYWPNAPWIEADAMRRALEFYVLAVEDVSTSKGADDRVNVMQQMARIHIKLEEYPRAIELLREAIVAAREAVTLIDRDLRGGDSQDHILTQDERSELISLKRRLQTLVVDSEGLSTMARDAQHDSQTRKARVIMAGLAGKSQEEIRNVLKNNQIDAVVISKLIPPEVVKKGLFSFLK